jgi:hypothetical protein
MQEKVKTTIIEVQSKIYDKSTAYTNLIMIGGYAGSFATWAATRPQLPAKANVTIALSLTISLASFILFEVYKMTYTAVKFLKNRHLLVQSLPPEKFFANLQKLAQSEQKFFVLHAHLDQRNGHKRGRCLDRAGPSLLQLFCLLGGMARLASISPSDREWRDKRGSVECSETHHASSTVV